MAQSNPTLIKTLRETAQRLRNGAHYEWGHMGRCNCGHLVQTVTNMSDREIVRSIDFELDEWTEHAKLYCDGTGHKVDDLFHTLEKIGFNYRDVINLEYLSDPEVLKALPTGRRYLRRNNVDDVIIYLETLADLLDDDQTKTVSKPKAADTFEAVLV